jgi:Acetyltransferase (GNAT) family
LPYFPDQGTITPASFKRSIRDLQVWCSSCMVAFSGSDAIGVLIGAKRPAATLVHKIAVHPDHRRQGHGRHLLTSLGSKLAILGPPRIVAEVPENLAAARGLFSACEYVEETVLTDYVLVLSEPSEATRGEGVPLSERENAARVEGLVIPVTIDDLAANGLLEEASSQTCWERSVETLTARKDDIAGLAVASDERIEACLLYVTRGTDPPTFATSSQGELRRDLAGASAEAGETEIVSLRSFIEDGGTRSRQLLAQLHAHGMEKFRFPKVHPAEISKEGLETLGFKPAGGHRLFAARARSD